MAKRVLVGMSGGVDSAACVLLLQKQGYDVSGVTLRLHHYKDRPGTCGSADDIEEAARVAAQMGVSHRVLDLCDLFRREVMGHFVSEYCAGRTPNPCLDCNRELKFGAMLDWALDHGFDYVSTGHYARVGFDAASGRHLLLRGVDAHKDQSYVLYQMTQRQLAHLLLPVGEYSKPEIRALAADFGLENAQKPDSQDICFVPDGDYVRFLREFGGVTPEPGDFVDTSGRVLGRHRGLVAYTAGQRKGLGVSADRPLYVLSKDAKHNTVLPGDERSAVLWWISDIPDESTAGVYSIYGAEGVEFGLPYGAELQVVFHAELTDGTRLSAMLTREIMPSANNSADGESEITAMPIILTKG